MATQLQLRRGTAAENAVFTGAEGELTMSTDTKALQIHDGSTTGGFIVDTVVAFQKPTSQNDYTWARKYASGWVEQGGLVTDVTNSYSTKTLPVEMADTNYTLLTNTTDSFSGSQYSVANAVSTTTFQIKYSGSGTVKCAWQVSGMAA